MLRCNRCPDLKETSHFKPRPKITRGFDYTCNECLRTERISRTGCATCKCGVILTGKRATSAHKGVCSGCLRQQDLRRCSSCREVLNLDRFPGRGKTNYWCKLCVLERLITGKRERCSTCHWLLREGHCSRCLGRRGVAHCLICDTTKSLTEFYKNHRSLCKLCFIDKNPKSKQLLRVGPRQYVALMALQKGGCAICGATSSEDRRMCVDHDHATDRVRGLLCGPCNRGLGLFRDSPTLLAQAIEYLAQPPAWALSLDDKPSGPPRDASGSAPPCQGLASEPSSVRDPVGTASPPMV